MADKELKAPVTIEELLVSALGTNDAIAKLLTREGIDYAAGIFLKLSEERATYNALLNPTKQ